MTPLFIRERDKYRITFVRETTGTPQDTATIVFKNLADDMVKVARHNSMK